MPNFPLCEMERESRYHVPDDGDVEVYKQHIRSLPGNDHPVVLGQHPNAQIASQIQDTQDMLDTLLSLQPRRASQGTRSPQAVVLDLARDLLEQVPPQFDLGAIHGALEERPDPVALITVLKQELERYSRLIAVLRNSLDQLQRGLQGLVVITPEVRAPERRPASDQASPAPPPASSRPCTARCCWARCPRRGHLRIRL